MSKISQKKVDKIKSDILALLYEVNLKPLYTIQIANEIARDDEFVLRLLRGMEQDSLVKQANKGSRRRWKMTDKAYGKYLDLQ